MDKRKVVKKFSDADFFELIKDDPEAMADYKKGLVELLTRKIYSKDIVMVLVTGRTNIEADGYYTSPELTMLNWQLDFLTDNACGLMYIHKLMAEKKK